MALTLWRCQLEEKEIFETLPLLHLDLESESRPSRWEGPTRLSHLPPHSAVYQGGRRTEKLVECGRSDYQRLIPETQNDKKLRCKALSVFFLYEYIFIFILFWYLYLQEVLHWYSNLFFDLIVKLCILQLQDCGQTGLVLKSENSFKALSNFNVMLCLFSHLCLPMAHVE